MSDKELIEQIAKLVVAEGADTAWLATNYNYLREEIKHMEKTYDPDFPMEVPW
jgi:hypothetical protein